MQKTIIGVIVVALLAIAGYWYYHSIYAKNQAPPPADNQQASTTPPAPVVDKTKTVIGKSVSGADITAYHFGAIDATGTTTKEILFIGGIHGGYEWNTALVAYELMDYLKSGATIPANVKVTVIPVANPDGLKKVVAADGKFAAADVNTDADTQVSGRFNANTVDLNRNFDCDWKASGVWQTKPVSGGAAAFSEPETQALKSYIESAHPTAVVVWFSSAGGVYASNCHNGVLAETTALTKLYAQSSGYPAHQNWSYYDVTGDVANWLAKIQIPSISVLLTNHTDTEWTKNQKGVDAVLQHYAQ